MGRAWRRRDSVLLVALASVLLFSCYGIRWGRVECWNPDEMASTLLRPNFLPATYAKPPFYPYVNHIVVLWWVDIAEWVVRRVDRHAKLNEVRLIASRLLVVAMFLGTTTIAYFATRRPFGIFAARVVALGFATSAGFIAFNNYLTVDSPMLFWMMLAFLFCQRILYRGELRDYIAAGIITGLATATKYQWTCDRDRDPCRPFSARRGTFPAAGVQLPVGDRLRLRRGRLCFGQSRCGVRLVQVLVRLHV